MDNARWTSPIRTPYEALVPLGPVPTLPRSLRGYVFSDEHSPLGYGLKDHAPAEQRERFELWRSTCMRVFHVGHRDTLADVVTTACALRERPDDPQMRRLCEWANGHTRAGLKGTALTSLVGVLGDLDDAIRNGDHQGWMFSSDGRNSIEIGDRAQLLAACDDTKFEIEPGVGVVCTSGTDRFTVTGWTVLPADGDIHDRHVLVAGLDSSQQEMSVSFSGPAAYLCEWMAPRRTEVAVLRAGADMWHRYVTALERAAAAALPLAVDVTLTVAAR